MSDRIQALSDDELAEISGGTMEAGFYYVVKRGDCLSVIAMRYGVDLQEIVKLNYLKNPNVLYEGQVLFIPFA